MHVSVLTGSGNSTLNTLPYIHVHMSQYQHIHTHVFGAGLPHKYLHRHASVHMFGGYTPVCMGRLGLRRAPPQTQNLYLSLFRNIPPFFTSVATYRENGTPLPYRFVYRCETLLLTLFYLQLFCKTPLTNDRKCVIIDTYKGG